MLAFLTASVILRVVQRFFFQIAGNICMSWFAERQMDRRMLPSSFNGKNNGHSCKRGNTDSERCFLLNLIQCYTVYQVMCSMQHGPQKIVLYLPALRYYLVDTKRGPKCTFKSDKFKFKSLKYIVNSICISGSLRWLWGKPWGKAISYKLSTN